MQMVTDYFEFCKQRRLDRLRAELGADVCLMLEEEGNQPIRSLLRGPLYWQGLNRPDLEDPIYLPFDYRNSQQPITLRSGYTTQPGTTTMIDQVEVLDVG